MAELWGRAGGVNRKLRELYARDGGANRKLREMWARDSGAVGRKIFSGAITWTIDKDCTLGDDFGYIDAPADTSAKLFSGGPATRGYVDFIFSEPLFLPSGTLIACVINFGDDAVGGFDISVNSASLWSNDSVLNKWETAIDFAGTVNDIRITLKLNSDSGGDNHVVFASIRIYPSDRPEFLLNNSGTSDGQ